MKFTCGRFLRGRPLVRSVGRYPLAVGEQPRWRGDGKELFYLAQIVR